MPTIFEGTPDFPDVLRGADLVIVGRLAEIIDEESDLVNEDIERTIITARFEVESVLKGDDQLDHVDVRLVPDLAEHVSGKQRRDRVVIALNREPSRTEKGERYVPYFSTILALEDDRLQAIGLSQQREQAVGIPESVEELRRLIDELRQERDLETEAGYAAGEDDLGKDEQGETEVTEMPELAMRGVSGGELADLTRAEIAGLTSTSPHDESTAE